MSLAEVSDSEVPWPSRSACPGAAAAPHEQVCRMMEAAVAAAFAVPLAELRARSRRTQGVAFARQSAMYLAHVVLGLNYSATGMLFHRDRTTAAYACQIVEDRRDDPRIDRLLQHLEGVCLQFAEGAPHQPPVRQ